MESLRVTTGSDCSKNGSGSIGSPTTTRMGARLILIPSIGMACWLPQMATGTTGTEARTANQAAPVLSGISPQTATRRPSGNTPMGRPDSR